MYEDAVTYHVATDGDDRWSGSLASPNAQRTDGPFATLYRARDEIRQLKYAGGGALDRPVNVLMRGGAYMMDQPLRLAGGDSGSHLCPVTYEAYPGERPVISGGQVIDGWERHTDDIYRASLPAVRDGRWWFRQLFCDGKRMIRARYPKFDTSNPRYGGWAFVEELVSPAFDLSLIEQIELDRPWRFKTDPDTSGVDERWFAPDVDDGDWDQLSTTQQWNHQGYKSYKGAAWYRQRLTVPDDFDSQEHFWLLFGAVDKAAHIYIDGRKVFEHTIESTGLDVDAIWQTSFKFDVRPWLAPGVEHVIAVLVESNEGFGGIWRPVSLVSADHDVPPDILAGKVQRPMSFRHEPDIFPHRWARPDQAEVFIVPGKSWISDIIPIKRVDAASRTIHLHRPVQSARYTLGSATHIDQGNRFFVENNLEDLTEPGEWCLDADEGVVYFRPPGGDIDTVTVTAPATIRLVQMVGSADHPLEHVTVRGFTLTQTQADWPRFDSYYKTPNAGQAVYMEHTQDCTIEDCVFDAVGGDAIRIQNKNARNRITGNHIFDAGAYGIFVGEKQFGYCRHDPKSADVPSPPEWFSDRFDRDMIVKAWPVSREHLISNNHIHDVGYFEKHASGIAFFGVSASDVVVSHNLIHHTPRFGIGMMSGFGRITIEYNHIHHTSMETADTGAITANRWYTYDKHPDLARGNIIRFNCIHDSVGCGAYEKQMEPGGNSETGGRIWTRYYSWAIYFDNAPMDVLVYGNICARNTLGGIMISHYGNNVTVENNIFVDSSTSQAYFLFSGQMSNIVMRRNIFSYRSKDANYLRMNLMVNSDPQAIITEHDRQLYHLPDGATLTFDGLPGEAVVRTGMQTSEQADTTLQTWRAMGFDANSVFADPKFVDPANDDYTLRPDSPAFELGFQPIDTDRIGLLNESSSR